MPGAARVETVGVGFDARQTARQVVFASLPQAIEDLLAGGEVLAERRKAFGAPRWVGGHVGTATKSLDKNSGLLRRNKHVPCGRRESDHIAVSTDRGFIARLAAALHVLTILEGDSAHGFDRRGRSGTLDGQFCGSVADEGVVVGLSVGELEIKPRVDVATVDRLRDGVLRIDAPGHEICAGVVLGNFDFHRHRNRFAHVQPSVVGLRLIDAQRRGVKGRPGERIRRNVRVDDAIGGESSGSVGHVDRADDAGAVRNDRGEVHRRNDGLIAAHGHFGEEKIVVVGNNRVGRIVRVRGRSPIHARVFSEHVVELVYLAAAGSQGEDQIAPRGGHTDDIPTLVGAGIVGHALHFEIRAVQRANIPINLTGRASVGRRKESSVVCGCGSRRNPVAIEHEHDLIEGKSLRVWTERKIVGKCDIRRAP